MIKNIIGQKINENINMASKGIHGDIHNKAESDDWDIQIDIEPN